MRRNSRDRTSRPATTAPIRLDIERTFDTSEMPESDPARVDNEARRGETPRALAWARFRSHRLAVVGTVFLVLLVLAVTLGPWVYRVDPDLVDPSLYRTPPGSEHPLGTDSAGRDVLARLLAGGRVSVAVGLLATLVATTVGLILGALAGYLRGWVDAVLSRVFELLQSFPTIILLLVLAAMFGPSLVMLVLVIGLMEWTLTFRVVRAMTLSLREQDSIWAIRGLGAHPARVMFGHILPSVLGALTVAATLGVGGVILTETTLSYLGLGVPPPTASWGNMLTGAQSLTVLETMPWMWLPPGLAIAATVLSVNFVGEGLRDAFDPKLGV